ncbi:Beta-mannosyltransferase 1 [Cladophialophora chaetospira]|uniref:Beta-mannosyltransferase 1 n=1 Tax=Cladophialophora chaetospira TaxID=386627 RepID=A0AA39CFH4_9EURO|nr:Beta-mannosyltransferase 1 [Cladophialophora chaetospira]
MSSPSYSMKKGFESLHQYGLPAKIPRTSRKTRIVTVLGVMVCWRLLFGFWHGGHETSPRGRYHLDHETGLDGERIETIAVTGFSNTGDMESRTCEDVRHNGELQVSNSRHITDDLEHIARSLAHHPMIDYQGMDRGITFRSLVAKTWARLSGSSVWVEKFQLYLTVTRVIFYAGGLKNNPVISFLAGQLHDKDWNELKNYTIQWQSEEIKFPTIFNIPAPYKVGSRWFGPEDPRVIIEEGVEDAEPIVFFNMNYDLNLGKRAMHVFRPFSNDTTVLSIAGQEERAGVEKNWAPFFINEHELVAPGRYKWPSHYIYFIYDYNPLRVLKCHKLNGWCNFIFESKVPKEMEGNGHLNINGRMTGGTNLVPLRQDSESDRYTWVGFPRSHINTGCTSNFAMYRPHLMIMTKHESNFYFNYISAPLDLGSLAFSEEALHDPCGEGQILIANSIAKWKFAEEPDSITLTLSVDDATVQSLDLKGVSKFVEQLPVPHDPIFFDHSSHNKSESLLRYTAIGADVLHCSMESAFY